MLPTVLKNLIAQYNEKGQFLLSSCNKKICWFNGKRFELWCKNSEIICEIYLDYTGKLFFVNAQNENFVSLRGRAVKFVGSNPILLFVGREIQVDSKTKYSYYYGTMLKNDVVISTRPFHFELDSNKGILFFQNHIYFFSEYGLTIEKFDLKTNQWIAIYNKKNEKVICNSQVRLYKNIFYIFAECFDGKQLNFCFDPTKIEFYDNKFILP